VVIRRVPKVQSVAKEIALTFTHIEDARLADAKYQLEGHLEPGARIIGQNLPVLRNEILTKFLNRKLLN
jgi:hypothetical protein